MTIMEGREYFSSLLINSLQCTHSYFCHHKGGPEWTLTLVVTVRLDQRINVPPYHAR